MNKSMLVVNFLFRSLFWGMVLGSLSGVLFQLILFGPVFYGIIGLVCGIIAGTILGLANGLLLAIVTIQFANPLDNTAAYKRTVSRTAVGFTLAWNCHMNPKFN